MAPIWVKVRQDICLVDTPIVIIYIQLKQAIGEVINKIIINKLLTEKIWVKMSRFINKMIFDSLENKYSNLLISLLILFKTSNLVFTINSYLKFIEIKKESKINNFII